jgi:hypothetical protein
VIKFKAITILSSFCLNNLSLICYAISIAPLWREVINVSTRFIRSELCGRVARLISSTHEQMSAMIASSLLGRGCMGTLFRMREYVHSTTLGLPASVRMHSKGLYPCQAEKRRQPRAHTSVRASRVIPIGGSNSSGAR